MARKSSTGKQPKGQHPKGQPAPKTQETTTIPKALPPSPLSPRHEAFVANFMIHYNGSRAAREAGYSKKSAGQQAHELLKQPQIAAEITRRREEMAQNLTELSQDRIKNEIASVAFSNMKDFAPMFGDGTPAEKLALLTRAQGAAVSEIVVEEFRDGRSDWREVRRTKFKLNDKGRNLELLARVSGMVTDKVDHVVSGTIVHTMMQDIAARQEGRPIIDQPALPEPEGEDVA